jgi:DNA-3-methyladenine glycosylase II
MKNNTFSSTDFKTTCDRLAAADRDLAAIIATYGYPPMWSREQGFATLVHIILEQQVSLASARSALERLKSKVGTITPHALLSLTDEELRDCYFSRQKTRYVRHLAEAVRSGQLHIGTLAELTDEAVRDQLTAIKGIGQWTADVYLMMALHRYDLFPMGDVALIKSIKEVKGLPHHTSKEELVPVIETWRPYRTVAAYILWHSYLSRRGQS